MIQRLGEILPPGQDVYKRQQLTQALDLKPNTLVLVAAGAAATKSVGVLIKTFGARCV